MTTIDADIITGLIALGSAISGALASIPAWVGVLINLGMTLLSYLMQKKPDKPNDQQQVLRQEAANRQVVLGRDQVGGYVILIETYNGRFYNVQYFTEGEADYTGADVYIDGRLTTFDKDGNSEKNPTNGYIYFDKRSGTVPGKPYQWLLDEMSEYVNQNYRGDGMSTGLTVARPVAAKHAGEVFPAGIPSARVTANWGTVYDPRTKKTAFSRNLVLHALHYLRSLNGCGYADDFIDLSGDFSRAAAIADEIMFTRGGGSVRRYEGSTGWSLAEKRGAVIPRLMAPMDGRLYMQPTGKIGISVVGKWIAPDVHIPDDVIIDAEIRRGPKEEERAREVVLKWKNPAAQYTVTTSRPWIIDGPTEYERKEYEIGAIQSHHHARRMAKIIADKLNPEFQGWIETTLYGMKAWTKRFILVSFTDAAMDRVPCEVEGIRLDRGKCTVRILIRSVRPSRYDFDAATEEGDTPVVPVPIGEKDPVLPTGVKVTATIGASGTALKMKCNVPRRPGEHSSDPETIGTEWFWAEANSEVWISLGRSESVAGYVSGIQSRGPFDVKVRHYGTNLVASDDVIVEDITPTEPNKTPPKPTGVTVKKSTTAAGTALVGFTTPPDGDAFAGIEIWRGASADAATATLVSTAYRSQPGSYAVEDEAGAGSYHYFAATVTWGGTRSARVAAKGNPIRL